MGNCLLDTECNKEGGRKEIKPNETKQGVHRKIGHFQKFATKRNNGPYPIQARTRNLSTGEFVPKCPLEFPPRPSAEYDSAPSRKFTPHFGSVSLVSVNK